VLITQFQEKEHSAHLAVVAGDLVDTIASTVRPLPATDGEAADDGGTVDRDVAAQPLSSPFDSRLLALPATWNEVCDLIERIELRSVLARLADTLHPPAPVAVPTAATRFGDDLFAARRALHDLADRLVYAESVAGRMISCPRRRSST
jgi:hypothetical protein